MRHRASPDAEARRVLARRARQDSRHDPEDVTRAETISFRCTCRKDQTRAHLGPSTLRGAEGYGLEALTILSFPLPARQRWSCPNEATVREIAAEFRQRRIPCDTVVVDIDYMQDYRNFTVSRERFPNFDNMVVDLAKLGFHIVPIVDPGIKKSQSDPVYVEGVRRDVFCRASAGKPSGRIGRG